MPVKRRLDKSSLCADGKTPVFSSESNHNGILGYTNIEADYKISENNPIYVVFGDHTRSFHISTQNFCVTDNVKVLLPKIGMSMNTLLFITTAWEKCIPNRGYSRHWNTAKKIKFTLPTKGGEIDFAFMESFIAELEAQRITGLDTYLSGARLKDTTLTDAENQALLDFADGRIQWKEYRIGSLFERIETNKLPYKAKELPKNPVGNYTLPCLTSSFHNQGLSCYALRQNATVLKDVISIPSNSDVYRAYYQSREFTVLSDAYAIRWSGKEELSPNQYLFTVACINKRTKEPLI